MDAPRTGAVLGRAGAATGQDPFGEGDPVEVARLVRRALAAADRRALDVALLVVVAEAEPDPARLVRFTRRALGPHGAEVPAVGCAADAGADHEARVASAVQAAARLIPDRAVAGIAVALGPGPMATALCVVLATDPPAGSAH